MVEKRKEVRIERLFNAPRELVFKAWSDAEILKHWYAPVGCTLPFCKIDFRTGGALHMCISNPEFGDCWVRGTYREIDQPGRIVFHMAFADEKGNYVDRSPAGKDPEWPKETVVTVTFEDLKGKTKLTLHQSAPEAVAKRTGAYQSWLSMLDRLAHELRRD